MIIRFQVKNIYSFKDETEFNLFPNKSRHLNHHKKNYLGIEYLRLSAIYGANGSGKSNLIKSIALLEKMIEKGRIPSSVDIQDLKFKLDDDYRSKPISLGIEFLAKGIFYFYTLTFDTDCIIEEALYISNKEKDQRVFSRKLKGDEQKIEFPQGYTDDPKKKLFVEVLGEKLLQKNELLLSFLNKRYNNEYPDVVNVFDWLDSTLVVIRPNAAPGGIAQIFDHSKQLFDFANKLMPTLNTGIHQLTVTSKKLKDLFGTEYDKSTQEIIERLKKEPEAVSVVKFTTGEEASLVYENGEVIVKQLVPVHKSITDKDIEFKLSMESDGTNRLIEYIPAINGIINEERVYIIDEIERSIHPKTIKEIISKISLDEKAKGQLIFSTHESCLLDQEILRPDEIWFAQKDILSATKLYPLSDYHIHHTANIENGYLLGRYGGIPFLSNLNDLNWHTDVSDAR